MSTNHNGTVTEEHDRLQRLTKELCEATEVQSVSLDWCARVEHQVLQAALREAS